MRAQCHLLPNRPARFCRVAQLLRKRNVLTEPASSAEDRMETATMTQPDLSIAVWRAPRAVAMALACALILMPIVTQLPRLLSWGAPVARKVRAF